MTVTEDEVRSRLSRLADRARTRPAHPIDGYTFEARRPTPGRRPPPRTLSAVGAGIAAAILIAVTAVALAGRHGQSVKVLQPSATSQPPPTIRPNPTDHIGASPAEISVLPPPPSLPRSVVDNGGNTSTVWTGSQWILTATPSVAYTPGSGWQTLPAAPVTLEPAAELWTGSEVLVFNSGASAGGATYNPAARTWAAIPTPPVPLAGKVQAVWTGHEAILDSPVSETQDSIEAYDPARKQWRLLASSPGDLSPGGIAWSGSYLYGYAPAPSGTGAGDLLIYDLTMNRWRAIPVPVGGINYATVEWYDNQVLLLSGGSNLAYTPATQSWRTLAAGPPRTLLVAWTGKDAIFADNTDLVVYDSAGDKWTDIGTLESASGVAIGFDGWQAVWSGHELYMWLQSSTITTQAIAVTLPSDTRSQP